MMADDAAFCFKLSAMAIALNSPSASAVSARPAIRCSSWRKIDSLFISLPVKSVKFAYTTIRAGRRCRQPHFFKTLNFSWLNVPRMPDALGIAANHRQRDGKDQEKQHLVHPVPEKLKETGIEIDRRKVSPKPRSIPSSVFRLIKMQTPADTANSSHGRSRAAHGTSCLRRNCRKST